MNSEEETWKDIVGYEGMYQVSNLGNVKSLKRKTKGRYNNLVTTPERILKPSLTAGYPCVFLSKNNVGRNFVIHRLVATAFIPKTQGTYVNHKDCNKRNCHIDNLEWCTQKENVDHAVRMGVLTFPNYPRIAGSKSVCSRGHIYNEANTYIQKGKYKVCRKCSNMRRKMCYQRSKLQSLQREIGEK